MQGVTGLKNGKRFCNVHHYLFILLILAVLFLGLVRTVVFPKEINHYENRYSEKVIAPALSAVLDQSFQNSMEDALADQIPKAQWLKKLYNHLNSVYLDSVVKPLRLENPDKYINYLGMQLFGSDQIVYSPNRLEDLQQQMDVRAGYLNALAARYPDLPVYCYFIERDVDINFETGEKTGAREYIYDQLDLPPERKETYVINDYPTFRKYFFMTDHHWNHVGAHEGYLQVHRLLGIEEAPVSCRREVLVSTKYTGSKAAATGSTLFREDLLAYDYELPPMTITVNGVQGPYGEDISRINPEETGDYNYIDLYGGDDGEVIFDTGRPERENLLVIGESYDNPLLKPLAAHYNQTFSIDLRNYEHYMGSPFSFDAYLQEHEIDRVLLIGNVNFYVSDVFNMEME